MSTGLKQSGGFSGTLRLSMIPIGTRPVTRGTHMHKSLVGLAAATVVGLATLAGPGTANAGCYGCAVGAGIIGGVAAGAIIGSAIANNPPPPPAYYPPPPGYYPPPPAYGPPPPPPGPGYAEAAP